MRDSPDNAVEVCTAIPVLFRDPPRATAAASLKCTNKPHTDTLATASTVTERARRYASQRGHVDELAVGNALLVEGEAGFDTLTLYIAYCISSCENNLQTLFFLGKMLIDLCWDPPLHTPLALHLFHSLRLHLVVLWARNILCARVARSCIVPRAQLQDGR